jgi:hypothetical protein
MVLSRYIFYKCSFLSNFEDNHFPKFKNKMFSHHGQRTEPHGSECKQNHVIVCEWTLRATGVGVLYIYTDTFRLGFVVGGFLFHLSMMLRQIHVHICIFYNVKSISFVVIVSFGMNDRPQRVSRSHWRWQRRKPVGFWKPYSSHDSEFFCHSSRFSFRWWWRWRWRWLLVFGKIDKGVAIAI